MLIIVLLVLSCFIGAYSQDPSFQDTSEILEKFLLEAIKNNKTIDIDFGDSDEKPCIPLEAVSESTPVAGRRISEQKCYEYIEQMKNREKEEKWAERCHQSEVLRTATIPVIETKQCEPLLVQHRNRNWKGLTYHQICAGNLTGGVDTCQV
ncbi:unnamed protein product [Danaus chrysippus]|uniref:(African queen) hypothetical protein n=1 Tax=Danaus chrysippus TaxID=151541 RepID=A0A8J2QMN7_9NEOP|nr:unnamed protein product [Danaus chrysippus]